MQIPTNFSAAQAASIASVVSSRDKDASSVQAGNSADPASLVAQLEKSEGANPDRDAQGQGDGLGPHARRQHDENSIVPEESPPAAPNNTSPDDGQLDLMC